MSSTIYNIRDLTQSIYIYWVAPGVGAAVAVVATVAGAISLIPPLSTWREKTLAE